MFFHLKISFFQQYLFILECKNVLWLKTIKNHELSAISLWPLRNEKICKRVDGIYTKRGAKNSEKCNTKRGVKKE